MSSEPRDDEPPRIKVTDRRLFDAEGNFRTDVPEPESSDEIRPEPEAPSAVPPRDAGPAAAAPEPAERPSATRSAEAVAAEAPPQPATQAEVRPGSGGGGPGAAGAEGAPGRPPSPGELPRDLSGFIESQYYETLLYLGAIQHPQTGQVIEDLDLAQYKIDLLSMLQEKTEGNRTPEENQLLEDVLYQLRMAFLQKRKVAKL